MITAKEKRKIDKIIEEEIELYITIINPGTELKDIPLKFLTDTITEIIEDQYISARIDKNDEFFEDMDEYVSDKIYKIKEKAKNEKRSKQPIKEKFKKKKEEEIKPDHFEMNDTIFFFNKGWTHRFDKVDFHSVNTINKKGKEETVLSFIVYNINNLNRFNYAQGVLNFNLKDKFTELENKTNNSTNTKIIGNLSWCDIFGNNTKKFTYTGQMKVYSYGSDTLFEFTGTCGKGGNDVIKYMKERKETIKQRLEEEKERIRLANRKIKRRFTF
jgi:hypothetical protein